MDDLPESLIAEILARLPVKSLSRFRSVSKPWLSLISTPYLVNLHAKQASRNPNSRKIIISVTGQTPVFKSFDYESCSFDNHGSALTTLVFSYSTMKWSALILGSCNGLVCVASSCFKRLFIWNPYTGARKQLSGMVDPACHYGFGYDESTDDYKVFLSFKNKSCSVFSLKSGYWRSITCTKTLSQATGAYVNGALHWMSSDTSITSFDLADETFKELPLPESDTSFLNSCVVGFDGYLCVYTFSLDHCTLWAMKEYGSKESWTQLATIPSSIRLYPHRNCYPLCLTWNHDILFADRSGISKYDLKSNTSNVERILCNYSGLANYVETLVKPSGPSGIEN